MTKITTLKSKSVTVLVVYTNTKLTDKASIGRLKKYSFNTSSILKDGDMIETKEYDTKLQVVKVLDKDFKYFNRSTGELSNTFNSSSQWEIRELKLREDDSDVVYGKLIQ